ncbi:MAG: hypothetical protein C0469_07775 [Cyanobacteria bacterium DS2.3.42]|nr:hypothetical protein [Cyanobacteria bacterium DS2.3.42]
MWGLKDLAKRLQWAESTICHFFRYNQHTAFFQFKKLCDATKITMDDGAQILNVEDDFTRMHLWDQVIRKKYKTYELCADEAKISVDYITDLINGGTGKKIREDYQALKRELGMDLEELATILGDAN